MPPRDSRGRSAERVRVSFLEYCQPTLLDALAMLCADGEFGRIDSFRGRTRDRTGAGLAFAWDPRCGLRQRPIPCPDGKGPGAVEFRGRIGREDRNRLANFVLFHCRGHFRQPAVCPDFWRIPLRHADVGTSGPGAGATSRRRRRRARPRDPGRS